MAKYGAVTLYGEDSVYGVSEAVSKTLTIVYDLGGSLNTDLTMKYNVYNRVNTVTLTIKYELYNEIVKDLTIIYNLFNEIYQSMTIVWNLFVRVLKNLTMIWNLIGRTFKSLTIRWRFPLWEYPAPKPDTTWNKTDKPSSIWDKTDDTASPTWDDN